jgi:hypothetical protein
MLGRDFDSDDAKGLRGHAASPATAMIPEHGGNLTGIASGQGRFHPKAALSPCPETASSTAWSAS